MHYWYMYPCGVTPVCNQLRKKLGSFRYLPFESLCGGPGRDMDRMRVGYKVTSTLVM